MKKTIEQLAFTWKFFVLYQRFFCQKNTPARPLLVGIWIVFPVAGGLADGHTVPVILGMFGGQGAGTFTG